MREPDIMQVDWGDLHFLHATALQMKYFLAQSDINEALKGCDIISERIHKLRMKALEEG